MPNRKVKPLTEFVGGEIEVTHGGNAPQITIWNTALALPSMNADRPPVRGVIEKVDTMTIGVVLTLRRAEEGGPAASFRRDNPVTIALPVHKVPVRGDGRGVYQVRGQSYTLYPPEVGTQTAQPASKEEKV